MSRQGVVLGILQKRSKIKHNKRFKRDNQRVAFLLCVGFYGYGVMRKLGSGVGCPLTGRYEFHQFRGCFEEREVEEDSG